MNSSSAPTDDVEFTLEDEFVAPWGLAHEERPLHLIWSGEVDRVDIAFADPVEIVSLNNVSGDIDEYVTAREINGKSVTVIEVDGNEFEVPGYLSCEFVIPEIYEEVMVGQLVAAQFVCGDEIVNPWSDYTFTIRPQLNVKSSQESILLTDKGDQNYTVDVEMEYIGFGMAEVNIEAAAEGEIISQGESVYHDMVNALIASGILEKDSDQWADLEEQPEDMEFQQEGFEDFVTEFRDLLAEGSVFEEYDQETLSKIADILEEDDDETRDTSEFYEQLQFMLMNSILDVIGRHPTENVQLSSPQTKIELENKIRAFTIKYHLSDSQGNSYGSVDVPITVKDEMDSFEELEVDVNTDWNHVQLDPDEERERAINRLENE